MMTRECPVCHVPLNRVRLQSGLEIDFCPSCRGIWFDKNELTQMYKSDDLPEKMMGGVPNFARDLVVCQSCGTCNPRSNKKCESCGVKLRFLCPVCHKQLEETPVGQVQIDRCKHCKGVWLDGGELELFFDEFKQMKQAELARARSEGEAIHGDLAAWAALEAADTLIWAPELVYHAGEALGDVATELPGALAEGVGTVIEGVGNVPEVAGHLAEGAVEFAGNAADLAGGAFEGAMHLAGEVPEIAGAAAEAGASFIEMIFELIGSLFDN